MCIRDRSGLYPNNIEELEINYRRIVEINEYRKNIAYIDQNSYIFTDTIYQNISLYRNIDLRSIRKICKKLNICLLYTSLQMMIMM